MRKLLCLILSLALCFCFFSAFADSIPELSSAPSKETGTEDSVPSAPEERPEQSSPAKGYVLVTTATQMGLLPLPEEEDYLFPISQTLPDGTVTENIVHLTPEGVYMESSTCKNHDCIGEGVVTLENRKNRILGNMIICLPNQVTLQLFTPEEILSMLSPESLSEGE